ISVVQHDGPSRVVPDACMDVIFRGGRLEFAGIDTRPMPVQLGRGAVVVGVRFAPGHGQRILGISADALRDARVPLVEHWGDRARELEQQLSAAESPLAAAQQLEAALAQELLHSPPADRLVQAVIAHVERDPSESWSIAALAREVGVSERQLLRRCQAQLGYGPKVLARVLRFQWFRRELVRAPTRSLSELGLAAGYADQAHLGHEVQALAGTTPGQLQREAQQAASDSDKTSTTARVQARAYEDHHP
ncbi:MAG: AraC family transcriptional regulator, partial [Polyangiales bacterium]